MHTRGRRMLLWWARPLPRLVVVLGAAAFAAWEGLQGRFSTASHASILVAVGAVLVLALVTGRGRQRAPSLTWVRAALHALASSFARGRARTVATAGALVWALLIAAAIGWDATSFTEQRQDLPTLSRLFGDVTDHDWGRALVFAAWLVLGLSLATGWRRPVGGPRAEPTRTTGATLEPLPERRRSSLPPQDPDGDA